MRIRILVLGVVCLVNLCGQSRRFRWQDYCFNHPAAPFCSGHDYAVKRPRGKDGAAPQNAVNNPFPPSPQAVSPTLIVIGGIDWRFADPSPDALIGFNCSALAASPLAHSLVAQLGARSGLTEADVKRIFDGLSGVDQVAFSIRDNRIVVMITGSGLDSTVPTLEAGLKAAPVSGKGLLVGHADAVDEAVRRMAIQGPRAELTQAAEERQASSEFWAVGSATLVGPQAVSAGVQRVSLTASIQDRLSSDLAFEFKEPPAEDMLRSWQTTLGDATLEGNTLHVRMFLEADEARQKLSEIVANPVGERLAALIQAARYLPMRDTTAAKHTKPVIYGLDGGPKELK